MRLIDADRLKSYIDCGHLRPPTEVCFSELDVCNMVDKQPTIEAVQEWIPCSERLPKDLEPVNATWVNHNPPCYYMDIMNVPFTGTCVRYKGKWYWWDSTICDVLEEYGEQYAAEPINKYIEVIAWMPLPEPYKEGYDEN
jgi:hypothetical protein